MSSILSKLKNALSNTRAKINSGMGQIFLKGRIDDETLLLLEEELIMTDMGVTVSSKIINSLRRVKLHKDSSKDDIKNLLSDIIEKILSSQQHELTIKENTLNVILVSGVNGAGKTTSIGKMADFYSSQKKKIAIAACDTFRAAAVEQIRNWANKTNALLFANENSDPASVAYVAVKESLTQDVDILFIDTAGRLHNKRNLMDELNKIMRVTKKIDQSIEYHSLLVLDGTTGQNSINQVEEFKKIVDIDGLVITKLDGTSKAGALVGIVEKFNLPIYFIGIGESKDDIKRFSAKEFSRALIDL